MAARPTSAESLRREGLAARGGGGEEAAGVAARDLPAADIATPPRQTGGRFFFSCPPLLFVGREKNRSAPVWLHFCARLPSGKMRWWPLRHGRRVGALV